MGLDVNRQQSVLDTLLVTDAMELADRGRKVYESSFVYEI